MKLPRVAVSMVSCVLLACACQAQTDVSDFTWDFASNATNSSPSASTNPFSAVATASILGDLNLHHSGFYENDSSHYGTATGLWDILAGRIDLGISLGAVSVVEYTLKVTQFIGTGLYASFLPGTVGFPTLPSYSSVTRDVVQAQTGSMVGYWVTDTYHWNALGAPGPITLSITPGNTNSGEVLFDKIELTVKGELTSAPEPASLQLLALGALAVGMRAWSRRKASA